MIDMITNVLQSLLGYKQIIFGIIVVIVILIFINRDRFNMSNILRKKYKEEYDNFDENSPFFVENDDSKLKDFKPKKTSELLTYCDEKREECIEY